MAPLVRALARRRSLSHGLVLTGQHEGLAPVFESLAPEAIAALPFDPRRRTAAQLRERLHALLCGHFKTDRADLVLVHGDTASAIAGALAATDCAIPVGHVEAGLRSFDLKQPWPEEGNRLVIDALSALLFAPTERAVANLRRDWRVKGEVHLTGNTGIDALLQALDRVRRSGVPGETGDRKTILVTCHRKENQGEAAAPICAALKRLVRELPVDIALPLHTNPHVRRDIEARLGGEPKIRLVEPLAHEAMVALMHRCWIMLTDSGGLQEEGPALGKPVLVLRNVTERPEALENGSIELVGTEPDRIVAAVAGLLADPARLARMSTPSFPFGDGRAAIRIAEAVERWFMRGR